MNWSDFCHTQANQTWIRLQKLQKLPRHVNMAPCKLLNQDAEELYVWVHGHINNSLAQTSCHAYTSYTIYNVYGSCLYNCIFSIVQFTFLDSLRLRAKYSLHFCYSGCTTCVASSVYCSCIFVRNCELPARLPYQLPSLKRWKSTPSWGSSKCLRFGTMTSLFVPHYPKIPESAT